ncbi:MAG: sigma-70 family RNA polymerase sigma factor [Bacteroidales bacterium]|jgi:RNA polymerase sigma-70 factor (ECF subfamily)|nr:sigma-70 family RNA polymerase sigma factor [Bacteroidales bacterium]NMD03373.1 sigma-70 family RNA polymerase sigma factor [Bacteroidales bacterium]OQB59587.1 MAG: ECF RNA polymerase sigma factor SigE [Bacteroidetes bacterium ADurb.Bin145]HOU03257.1 sigma-70 family RNA polymerase sigma factor [Bacteroidales bacterium]HQK69289.1 sigma-70 family RNA polymerase sigma factor [Bacteroidales bacterium]
MADPVSKFECCDISLIINESYDQLRAWLIKKTGNIELSDDLTQEVMVKLVNAYNKNIFLHNPKGWLFEIARHSLSDHYRKSFLEEKYDSIDLQDTITNEVEEVDNTAADFLVPIIKLLPAKYSEPLIMSDIENIPLKIIGEKLGISLSATKMRVQRARKMLLNLFHECCEIEYTKSGKFSHCTVRNNCIPLIKIAEKSTL